MYVKERKNKDGSTSYTLKCSTKTANGFQPHTKTIRLPSNITGKKAIQEWLTKEKLAWKEELTHRNPKCGVQQSNVLFVDFARQYNEELLIRNPTGYAHYNCNSGHIKTIEAKLGKYLLSEITPSVLNDFFNYLMTRKYEKIKIVSKPAILTLINERHIPLHILAEKCEIAQTTLFAALHGRYISKATATKICNYLQIPMKEYFTVIKESRLYSYSANNGIKVFIHGVLQQAVRLRLIERNYASKDYILPVKGTKGTKKILESVDECRHFIECLNTEQDLRKKTAIALYIYLGLRNAEVCGLTWKNIDLKENTLSVTQNTIYAGKRFGTVTKEPKTQTSKRVICIPTALSNILREYRAWWLKEQELHGDLWANTDKVFVTDSGKDMNSCTLSDWLKKFELKHNLKMVTPHGLRHTSVTLQIANGVDVKTVAARVGHSDVQTTLNIYSHYTKEADKQAAETIDRLLQV